MTNFRCKFYKRAFKYNSAPIEFAKIDLEIVVKAWDIEEAISNGKAVIKSLGITEGILSLTEIEESKSWGI